MLATDEARAKTIADRFGEWAEAGEELHAPALMLYEAANALTRLIARGQLAAAALPQAWAAIERTPITYHPLRDGPAAVELALRLGGQSAYWAPLVRARVHESRQSEGG